MQGELIIISDQTKFELIKAREYLESKFVSFHEGLQIAEIEHLEKELGIRFPPDLAWLIQTGFPKGDFVDWRGPIESLRKYMKLPLEGICFDISHNFFWWESWDERPANIDNALEIAVREIAKAPVLIPLHGHSYIPASPLQTGNPIFSIHQSDIIQRGRNLAHHFRWLLRDEDEEEELELDYPTFSESYTFIPFWSEIAKKQHDGLI